MGKGLTGSRSPQRKHGTVKMNWNNYMPTSLRGIAIGLLETIVSARRAKLKSPVRENRTLGSVRGAPGNGRSYRDKTLCLTSFFSFVHLTARWQKRSNFILQIYRNRTCCVKKMIQCLWDIGTLFLKFDPVYTTFLNALTVNKSPLIILPSIILQPLFSCTIYSQNNGWQNNGDLVPDLPGWGFYTGAAFRLNMAIA